MKKNILILLVIFFITNTAYAIVGDWMSYGSQLTLKDLRTSGNGVRMSSYGGMVEFDLESQIFHVESDYLQHIGIMKYYVNTDGSEWFSYVAGVDGISYRSPPKAQAIILILILRKLMHLPATINKFSLAI